MIKVLQQNTWINDRKFLKSYVWARAEQDNISHPAHGTWKADFVLQQNESRAFLGKYLNNPRVPWRHERREMMAIAWIIPVAKWLAKIKLAIKCRLQIMQKGTRTTRCEHSKFAGGDIWAHQQYLLLWNGDNSHGCTPLHLETSVCQHASCTNTNE